MRPTPIQTEGPPPGPLQIPPRGSAHAASATCAQPATGCSGEGAASAMQQWLRQHEERERVKDPAHWPQRPQRPLA